MDVQRRLSSFAYRPTGLPPCSRFRSSGMGNCCVSPAISSWKTCPSNDFSRLSKLPPIEFGEQQFEDQGLTRSKWRRRSLPILLVTKTRASNTLGEGDDGGCLRQSCRKWRCKLASSSRTLSSHVCRVKSRSESEQEVGESRRSEAEVGGEGSPDFEVDKKSSGYQILETEEDEGVLRSVGQVACWVVAVVYAGWLFLLPYAPGDPVWAITPSTIQLLIEQSLNFFFVLPLASILTKAAGYYGLNAPVQHPTAEALFNFVIGWTLLFGPLLFTDTKRHKFQGSLETLWIIMLFLTNTALAPYMAIRQSNRRTESGKGGASNQVSPGIFNLDLISKGITSSRGASIVGWIGAVVGVLSILWALIGRPEAQFGGFSQRWQYFSNYVGQERLAYAFLWDIVLYAIFQPVLIGDNINNVKLERREVVRSLRFVPYVGLVVYVLGLGKERDDEN